MNQTEEPKSTILNGNIAPAAEDPPPTLLGVLSCKYAKLIYCGSMIKCGMCGKYQVTENGDVCEVCLAELKYREQLVVE